LFYVLTGHDQYDLLADNLIVFIQLLFSLVLFLYQNLVLFYLLAYLL